MHKNICWYRSSMSNCQATVRVEYNENVTVSAVFSELRSLATKLNSLVVGHHKLEQLVNILN